MVIESSYQNNDAKYQAVYNYINFRRYQDALNVLSGIPSKDGRWYYLSAIANAGLGNNFQANSDIQTALNMEPNNAESEISIISCSGSHSVIKITAMATAAIPIRHAVQAICAVICGVRIPAVSVWEAICAHACKC